MPPQTDTDKGDLLSNVDISSAAAEIMGNVLEKLQSAVKKTCTEEFSPENISVHFKPDLVSGEYFMSHIKTPKAILFLLVTNKLNFDPVGKLRAGACRRAI